MLESPGEKGVRCDRTVPDQHGARHGAHGISGGSKKGPAGLQGGAAGERRRGDRRL